MISVVWMFVIFVFVYDVLFVKSKIFIVVLEVVNSVLILFEKVCICVVVFVDVVFIILILLFWNYCCIEEECLFLW